MTTIIEVAAPGVAEYGAGGENTELSASAVSWPAIIAGAVVAAAASLILFALGTGLGLASISPWAKVGASVATFTVMSAIWLILTQWIASGLGGYLTGRLRVRWSRTHLHEVFFRDTAHGFLAWALATVITAALFSSAAVMATNAGAQAAAVATNDQSTPPAFAYDVDSLFRRSNPSATAATADARMEAARILAAGAASGAVPADDSAYLAQLVSTQTGIAPADAQQRVTNVVTREQSVVAEAKQAADKARKAGAALAIFTALSMVIGSLIACIAAALGGQQRDAHT